MQFQKVFHIDGHGTAIYRLECTYVSDETWEILWLKIMFITQDRLTGYEYDIWYFVLYWLYFLINLKRKWRTSKPCTLMQKTKKQISTRTYKSTMTAVTKEGHLWIPLLSQTWFIMVAGSSIEWSYKFLIFTQEKYLQQNPEEPQSNQRDANSSLPPICHPARSIFVHLLTHHADICSGC